MRLLLYCTAVRNLGLDELGFGYQGTGGASMRGHIESVLHFTFPGVDTGTERWRFERMSAGDVRPWLPFAHATVAGYFPNGTGGDKLWQAHGAWGGTVRGRNHAQWDGYSNFTPKMQTRMWFEWGHRLWPDAGFDWFLARMRGPDECRVHADAVLRPGPDRSAEGHAAIDRVPRLSGSRVRDAPRGGRARPLDEPRSGGLSAV